MMRRFQYDAESMSLAAPDLFHEEFEHLIPASKSALSCETTASDWSYESIAPKVGLPKSCTIGSFASYEVDQLRQLFSRMYQVPESRIDVCTTFKKYRAVTLGGASLGSHKSRSRSSSVMAEWNVELLGVEPKDGEKRPVRINYFSKHTALSCTYSHISAC